MATVVPRAYTYYVSAALFAIFGIKMLRDGWKMDPSEGQEELEEVQQDLRKKDEQVNYQSFHYTNCKHVLINFFQKLIHKVMYVMYNHVFLIWIYLF